MKRMMKTWALVAVAAMGLTACQNDIDEQIEAKDSVVVTFVTDSAESRTSVDTSGEKPVFSWDDEGESFAVLEQTSSLAKATSVTFTKDEDGKAQIEAEIPANAGQDGYSYVTIHPEKGFVADKTSSITSATLYLPENQYMYEEGTYDPEADLMVSQVVDTDAQPTEAQYVSFTRLGAVVKMTLKNFTLAEGDEIEKVIFTADGKNLAGNITANLYDPHNFTAVDGEVSSSVTINTTAYSNNEIYFVTLPTVLAAGDTYTVTIITSTKIYMKNGSIPAEKELKLGVGAVNRFGVDMSTSTVSDKWVLVTDASTLQSGDIVTFAAANKNRVMGCTYSGSYPYASDTEIIKMGDYLIHPIDVDANKKRIQHLVLAARGNGFDIYNGVDYSGDSKTGYIYASNSSSSSYTSGYLKLQAYPNNNTLFYISIADNGVATIKATDSEWENNCVRYYNNSGSSYHYFQLWNEAGITEDTAVCIYKLEGAEPVEIPVAGANFSVPTKAVVLEKDAVTETVLEDAKFNYLGEWTINVTANVKDSEDVAEWLTVEYDAENNCLTYVAEANEGTVRYATVTVTATHDGEEDIVKSFEVTQKGGPQTITLAEFVEKSSDANVEYIFSGRITSTPSSATGTYKITDGTNEASISYLYQEGNETAVYGNVDLKEGDVITVCTTCTGSKKGGSSSAHAIYKGYYNISVEEPAEVAYAGGNATLIINKVGTLIPEEEFGGSVADTFATLTLPEDDSNKATVAFGENSGYPRQTVATLTYGLATIDVTVVQGANPDPLKKLNWVLVEDASALKETDVVAIAAQEYDKALSTTISSSRRSATNATKVGKYLVPSDANAIQEFVLVNGTESGTFAFYDATNKGFIASTSTSTGNSGKLLNQAFNDENSSYKVTITEGATTIGNVAGDYSTNVITYNTSYNFYSAKTASKAVCLYRLEGVSGAVPVVAADVTANEAVISEDATAVATPISTVVFNYVDGWNFSVEVEEGEDWITVEYDAENTCLTYTATENTGEPREATVTITASRDGQDDLTWSFTVLQKGDPVEISIEEFYNISTHNYNIVYKLTGKLVTIPTSATSAFVLEDENGVQAKLKYFRLDDGKTNVLKNVELKVGDIVTATAIVNVDNAEGNVGNSTYPTTYRGHYRLTATTTGAIDYEGGTATINVSVDKYGNVDQTPTTISSSEVSADGVTYSFTDNNDGTATASVAFGENKTDNARSTGVITFTAGRASTTATIVQDVAPAVKAGGWWLVLDANELKAGDKVIIAATGTDYAISTATNTNNRKSTAITKNGGTLENVSESVQQYALEIVDTFYAFKGTLGDDIDKYIYAASSSSNYMKVTKTLDDNGKFTVEIGADGAATITAQGTNAYKYMQYNTATTSSTPAFFCSDGSQGAVCLYKYYE